MDIVWHGHSHIAGRAFGFASWQSQLVSSLSAAALFLQVASSGIIFLSLLHSPRFPGRKKGTRKAFAQPSIPSIPSIHQKNKKHIKTVWNRCTGEMYRCQVPSHQNFLKGQTWTFAERQQRLPFIGHLPGITAHSTCSITIITNLQMFIPDLK